MDKTLSKYTIFDTIRNGYKARKALILREPCLSGVKIKCTQVNGVKRIFVFGLPTVTGLKLILEVLIYSFSCQPQVLYTECTSIVETKCVHLL